jgi:hypothetical protein
MQIQETAAQRYERLLSLDHRITKACFTPFMGEFGWYIMTHTKRVHAFNADQKIAFIKRGHEALFPSINEFIYDWDDIPDSHKAGVVNNPNINDVLSKIRIEATIIYHTDISWPEKQSLAHICFTPRHNINHNLKVDVVLAPRKRTIDAFRNLGSDAWQSIANWLVSNGLSVGVVGNSNTTHYIGGNVIRSSDYIDVDTDIELINSAKCIICQESGMLYLAAMCKKPVFIIDWCHREIFDLHRDKNVFFRITNPSVVANEAISFCRST